MYFTAHQRSKEPPGRGDITQITMCSMSGDYGWFRYTEEQLQ